MSRFHQSATRNSLKRWWGIPFHPSTGIAAPITKPGPFWSLQKSTFNGLTEQSAWPMSRFACIQERSLVSLESQETGKRNLPMFCPDMQGRRAGILYLPTKASQVLMPAVSHRKG
ncbi:hypothetical protein BBOU_0194 [Bifidobacterium boum]|uniref:Uncharacterized protein n=1 Tax=Bifidobacterium boum TaxID=78343 RepID=A0A086ZRE4_9BIFI|nr:hypothetical protein BBOU_0194 [Bifidobacterium boum]